MSRVLALFVGTGLLATGCASVPEPKAEIAKADLAYRKSEAVNAAELAPLDARLAREKMEKAKLEMSRGNYQNARWLAEEAEVDALVAEAKARSQRVQRATEDKREAVDELKNGVVGNR
jgi:hypothetical protein